MKDLIIICPTRGRIEKCKEMVFSFEKKSEFAELLLIFDEDDVGYYDEFKNPRILKIFFSKRNLSEPLTAHINKLGLLLCDRYRFLGVVDDDFVFITRGWDSLLINKIRDIGKLGIAYGNDGLQEKRLPTFCIISSEIIKVLGWLKMPSLQHLFADNVWKVIGDSLKCLHYCPSVVIEHRHPYTKNNPPDETFKKTNSKEMYHRDELAFYVWLESKSKEDIEKIRRIL